MATFSTWSDQTLNKALKKYIQKDSFCDVTLVSDDYQKFQAHKIVLAANSSVLEMLLLQCTQTDAIHTVLHIRGFNGLQIQKLLQLLYHGEVTLEHNQASDFSKLASDLKIQLYDKHSGKTSESLYDAVEKDVHENHVQTIKHDNKILNENNITLSLLSDEKLSQNSVDVQTKIVEKKKYLQNLKLLSQSDL